MGARAFVALGGCLGGYFRWLAPRVELRGAGETPAAPASAGRVFVCYRNQDVPALALALCRDELKARFGDVVFAVDDSLGGYLNAGLDRAFGHEILWLRQSSPGARARDVQALIRSRARLGIAVDTGGPYGRVLPSLPRLAARCQAWLVPVVARVSRGIPVWHRPLVALPLPGAILSVTVGEAIEGGGAPEVLRRLQQSLERADERAREQLRSGGASPGP